MSPQAKELFFYMIIITIVCAIEVKVILIFIEFTFNFKIDEMMKTRNILMAQISQYQDINKNMKCYLIFLSSCSLMPTCKSFPVK